MGPECEWHRKPYLRFREQHLSTWYVWPGCLRRLSRHPTTTITPNQTKRREHHAFLSPAISCVRPSTRTNTPSSPTNRLPRPILADPDQCTVVLLTESDPPFTRSSLHTLRFRSDRPATGHLTTKTSLRPFCLEHFSPPTTPSKERRSQRNHERPSVPLHARRHF